MNMFRDKQTGKRIALNLKVMFTFFQLHPRFERRYDLAADYFITRNPYDRALSTWFDKCITHPLVPDLQFPQMRLLEASKRQTLSDMPFSEFCALLPTMWKTDEHFWPQTYNLKLRDVGQVVRMETDLPMLAADLNLNFSKKENATAHGPFKEYADNLSADLIAAVYRYDFDLLRYSANWK